MTPIHLKHRDVFLDSKCEDGRSVWQVGKYKICTTSLRQAILSATDAVPEVYQYTYTDTFGGQRNYSWAERGYVIARSPKEAMRAARAALKLTGVKGEASCDGMTWTPRESCTILDLEIIDD